MITVRVNGLPAPQGSKRHVGNGVMVESSAAVKPWREAIRAEVQRVVFPLRPAEDNSRRIASGPVIVTVTFWLPRPRGHYGTGRNAGSLRPSAPARPHRKPDLDKLARAVLDAVVMGGAVGDDSQVVTIAASKWYADHMPPGCAVTIESLEPYEGTAREGETG